MIENKTRQQAARPNMVTARSSPEKVLGIIDLFTEDAPRWTVEAMAARLEMARTTAYRYAKMLVDAGFLAAISQGVFVLGPRFIELDRQIRIADPLLRVAPPIMQSIRDEVNGIQLLCSYYGQRVICVYDDVVDRGIFSSFERGRPFPLFRGGPSRVILAHLQNRQLQALMLQHAHEIAQAGLGNNWKEFSRKLRDIRQLGYYAAPGEIHPGNFGVSAPIFHATGVAGCITLARALHHLKEGDIPLLIELALKAAAQINAGIRAS